MALLGTYMILKIDGAVIAETTSVSMLVKAKALDVSTYDTGLHGTFIGGKVEAAIAGTYLMATTGANWDVLWTAFRAGTEVDVDLYRSGAVMTSGTAVIVKLRISGGNADKVITGGYALKYYPSSSSSITVDSTTITVDSTLITADAI